jgi:hypothetical protein
MVKSTKVDDRRRFLASALLGGVGTTVGRNGYNATVSIIVEIKDLLPTVGDSLAQYRERLRKILPLFNVAPLRPEIIGAGFIGLAKAFEKIEASVTPNYPSDGCSRKISDLISKGFGAVHLLHSRGMADLQVAQSGIDSVDVIVNYLNDLTILCRESSFTQAFATAARKTLDDLLKISDNYSKLVIFASDTFQRIKVHALAAEAYLSLAEIQFKSHLPAEAQRSVIKAKDELSSVTLIPLTPPQRREMDTFQILLDGCISWMKKGGDFSLPAKDSHHARLMPTPGLWGTVRQVLREDLPESSALRSSSCVALIGPILFFSSEPKERFEPIFNVLTSLFPSGKNDGSESNRKNAADRLARIEL